MATLQKLRLGLLLPNSFAHNLQSCQCVGLLSTYRNRKHPSKPVHDMRQKTKESNDDKLNRNSIYVKGVNKIPKRGTEEYQQQLLQMRDEKKVIQESKKEQELVPKFAALAIFCAGLPQSFALYKILWSDPCSDAFFIAFEYAFSWIAVLNALEGAAGTSLGYIDYRNKHTDKKLEYEMRKKKLAFAKFTFLMGTIAMTLIEGPSPNCVFPLVVGSIYSLIKFGTHASYELLPTKFYTFRLFLSMYNLAFLLLVWYKCRQGRKEKLDLEFSFYSRVEGVMLRMSEIFEDQNFRGISKEELVM